MITDFSPYLKDGVLDLNKEGNKFSIREGQSKNKEEQSKSEEVKFNRFEDIFDIERLAEFIKTTSGITAFNAVMWDIGSMGIDKFRSLMDAINESSITALNFENNTLSSKMAKEISKLSKLTELNLGFSNIGNKGIVKIVDKLSSLEDFDARGNYITDEGADAMIKALPKLKVLKIGYGNNISSNGLEKVVAAHINTLTEFDPFSNGYTKREIWNLGYLLPNCVFKLGPHWTRDVNDNNEAPINLNGVVWGNPPPVDPVGVVGDVLEG